MKQTENRWQAEYKDICTDFYYMYYVSHIFV